MRSDIIRTPQVKHAVAKVASSGTCNDSGSYPKHTSQNPMLWYWPTRSSSRPAAFSMHTNLTASHSSGGNTAKCCKRSTSRVVNTALHEPHSQSASPVPVVKGVGSAWFLFHVRTTPPADVVLPACK